MPDSQYDVIVVGAGSAGCVLAARLSENHRQSVLLIEAGPDYPSEIEIPPDVLDGYAPTLSHDWGYAGEPNADGRSLPLARARLVGGCSATNATIAVRGAPSDYDSWAAAGNAGWSFEEVLPFFRRLETDLDFQTEWHGAHGPISIRRYSPGELTRTAAAALESCRSAGYASVVDLNAPGVIGAAPLPTNCVDGKRQSTALTYLAAARGRQNLSVCADETVDCVLFAGRKTTGIRLASGRVIATDRVILSAGAYGSPGILMRSGIGPVPQLRAIGVETVQELTGVGRNLVDHPYVAMVMAAPREALEEGAPWFQILLTARSRNCARDHDLHIVPSRVFSAPDSPTGAQFILLCSVLKPLSRGKLWLESGDPAVPPHIDLGFFEETVDVSSQVDALRIARELTTTAPLSSLVVEELVPGTSVGNSEAELARAARGLVETYNHPVGTCKMGPTSDPEAVVDSRGRVHGVNGLLVVDASIMPTIPAGNTNIPTIMMAERIADWMTADV